MSLYIKGIYEKLLSTPGLSAGQWTLWCKRPKTPAEMETVIIESVLTQRTGWGNVQKALRRLREHGVESLGDVLSTGDERLRQLVRPSGFYTTKAACLKELARFITEACGGTVKAKKMPAVSLRKNLLEIRGIGNETADDILLYAFEKPFFVIDEYTRRLVKQLGLSENLSYAHLQNFFQDGLGRKDYRLYQDFHALIVIAGKEGVFPL